MSCVNPAFAVTSPVVFLPKRDFNAITLQVAIAFMRAFMKIVLTSIAVQTAEYKKEKLDCRVCISQSILSPDE